MADTTSTCHSGKGRLIDYVVVSRRLRPYVLSLLCITTVPWGPHDALALRLGRRPREVQRQVLSPVTLLPPPPAADSADSIPWGEALRQASMQTEQAALCHRACQASQEHAAEAMGGGQEAHELCRAYAAWARALELQAYGRAGPPGPQQLGGRAFAPRVELQTVLGPRRLTPEDLHVRGGYGIIARLWATAVSSTHARRESSTSVCFVSTIFSK